jgi:hypothetical protein
MKDTRTFKDLYEARHEPENLRPIAELYWQTLLLSSIVGAICVIVFGIWEFSSVISIVSRDTTGGGAQEVSPIDRTQLDRTLTQFAERAANYELAKPVVPAVTDPSK